MKIISISMISLLVGLGMTVAPKEADSPSPQFPGWKTNFSKRSVDLGEIRSGGPPKDGIPAIDAPKFVAPEKAASWLAPKEPVIASEGQGQGLSAANSHMDCE